MGKLNKEQFMDKVRADQEKKQRLKEKGEIEAKNFVYESKARIDKRMHGERVRRGYRW